MKNDSITLNSTNILRNIFAAILSVIVLFLCLSPAIYKAGYGANGFDEPYQIMNGLFYKNVPFAPLSAYLTGVLGNLFDWHWLYFRYVAIGINALCIILGGCVLYIGSHRFWLSLMVTASSLLVGTLFPEVHNLYGWDRWSELAIVLTMIVMLIYIRKPSIFRLIALAIISSLAIMMRLPNVVIIPIVSLCILFLGYQDNKLRKSLFFAGGYILFSIIFIFCIIICFFGSLHSYIFAIESNGVDSHGLSNLVHILVFGFLIVVSVVFLLLGLGLVINFSLKFSKWCYIVVSIALIWTIYFSILRLHTIYFVNILDYSAALGVLGVITILYHYRNRLNEKVVTKILVLFFLATIPVIGSNTLFAKFLVWPLMPIICLYLIPFMNQTIKTLYTVVIISFLAYSYYGLRHASFGYAGFIHATYTIDTGIFKGITMTEKDGRIIDSLMKTYMPYHSDYKNIVLRQKDDFIYEYLFLARNNFLGSKFLYNKNSKEYVDWVKNEISNSNKPVAVLYMMPYKKSGEYDYSPTLMQEMLQKTLTATTIKPEYIIFTNSKED